MRFLAVICLLSSVLCVAGADKPRFNAKDLESPAARKEREAAAIAEGAAWADLTAGDLLLRTFQAGHGGWGYVTIINTAKTSRTFDYHQLRGVEMDTGNIVEAGNVTFELKEIASFSLSPGQKRTFRVFFAGRRIAAVAWQNPKRWRTDVFDAGVAVKTVEDALTIARKAMAERRLAERKNVLRPVEGQVVTK